MIKIKRLVFNLLIFLSAAGCTVPTIQSKFGINIPESSVVAATNHDLWATDWSVAWLIEVHSEEINIVSDFVPKDFEVLPFSDESHMKNHYYRTKVFNNMFDSNSFKFGNMNIYVGGPDGNSYVAISKDKKQVIYYQFKT